MSHKLIHELDKLLLPLWDGSKIKKKWLTKKPCFTKTTALATKLEVFLKMMQWLHGPRIMSLFTIPFPISKDILWNTKASDGWCVTALDTASTICCRKRALSLWGGRWGWYTSTLWLLKYWLKKKRWLINIEYQKSKKAAKNWVLKKKLFYFTSIIFTTKIGQFLHSVKTTLHKNIKHCVNFKEWDKCEVCHVHPSLNIHFLY